MQNVEIGQVVAANLNYISCETGVFDDTDFVMCKLKNEIAENTVMFFAYQINQIDNESSS
jgi:hypothetical protein